ncbi:MAG: ABC transporter substrate-binding protein [Planctomycetota bacterium]
MNAHRASRTRARIGLVAVLLAVTGASASRAEDAPPVAPPAAAPTPPAIPDPAEPEPYGRTPDALVPHKGAGAPASRFFLTPPTYRGPGADDPEPADVTEVRFGVLAPLSGVDAPIGRRIVDGYTLAIEDANAAGGLRPGVPFRLLPADENDTWGAAGNALVELTTHRGCLAVLGALDDQNSHVMTRVLLKLNVPMVNTGGTDPTLTEHMIPWLVRLRPDDRQAAYLLARRIFLEANHQRVVFFRGTDRYARQGVGELADAARRLGRPVALEVRYGPDDTTFKKQVERIQEVKPDAVVMWGRPAATGRALAALRAAGVTVPVYGPDRLVDADFLAAAGAAAEGITLTSPLDPTRTDAAWTTFRDRFAARFGYAPDHHAATAYDGAAYLVAATRRAGLNRVRVRAALFEPATYAGVAGDVRFDVNHNDVRALSIVRVKDGAFVYGAP